jgi:P-type Cu+ transporter
MITKKVFKVLDMHCSSCAMRLEGLEDTIKGVKRISASYQKGQMQVEYDANVVSDDQILAAVKRLGYQATSY